MFCKIAGLNQISLQIFFFLCASMRFLYHLKPVTQNIQCSNTNKFSPSTWKLMSYLLCMILSLTSWFIAYIESFSFTVCDSGFCKFFRCEYKHFDRLWLEICNNGYINTSSNILKTNHKFMYLLISVQIYICKYINLLILFFLLEKISPVWKYKTTT